MNYRIRGLSFRRALAVAAFLCALGAIGGAITLAVLVRELPTEDEIANRQVSQSTKIYDRTGTVLLYEISAGERRTVIPWEEIPQSMKDAAVAAEDQRFYEGPAFSWKGILRALWVNLTHGEIRQGGSTITQQLAKNAFLSREQTVVRKVKELVLAMRIARNYSKDDILALYLNEVPFGSTLYGIEAASQAYFAKPARDLTLAESATLAALLRATTYYSPWGAHRAELIARQKYVLDQMLALGKISEEEHARAKAVELSFAPQSATGIKAPHFVLAVQDYLARRYGEEAVRRGGLTVRTTIDWPMQEIAERVVREGTERNEELYKGKNAALVAQDPRTGQVLALVGSRDYFNADIDGSFNVPMQGKRQPGSALKPFIYLAAFLKGYTPDTMLYDVPTEFAANRPDCPAAPNFSARNTSCFHPQNFDHDFRGPVSLRDALAQSINVPAVKTLYLAGMPDVLDLLRKFGMTTLDDPSRLGLSLVLGGGEVKLAELTGAYATLAADGVRHDQAMVLEVRDGKGALLERYTDRAEPAVDPQYARLVTDVLSDVEARSGLFHASLPLTRLDGRDVALKTGTTNNYKDAWTMGYIPSLAAGVWVGNNDNTEMQRQGSSILAALPIWHAFMQEAVKNMPAEPFERPGQLPPVKPVLAGNYAPDGGIHTILYYIDRRDPTGDPPENPAHDPQFANWEAAVQTWAQENPGRLPPLSSSTLSGGDAVVPGAPQIRLTSPRPGEFLRGTVLVAADITASSPVTMLRLYLNSSLVREFAGRLASPYAFEFSFVPGNTTSQNTVELEAISGNGTATKASVVVFR